MKLCYTYTHQYCNQFQTNSLREEKCSVFYSAQGIQDDAPLAHKHTLRTSACPSSTHGVSCVGQRWRMQMQLNRVFARICMWDCAREPQER